MKNELGLEHAWRWAREQRVPDGTTEMQLRMIGRQILRGETSLS